MPLAYFKPSGLLKEVVVNSGAACIQQSIMNFGILMIQGLVNTFGVYVIAAFAVGVKIDAFAYMPVQEYGNVLAPYFGYMVIWCSIPIGWILADVTGYLVYKNGP